VLGVASIAMRRAIPGMRMGKWCEFAAIASRDKRKAEDAAAKFGISKAYGSYEELLADPEIDAIYNPLPNHLHVPWTIRAAEAGKNVLCEKPIGLNAAEARQLIAVRDRTGVKIEEAFMVLTHPRWLRVRELVRSDRIGKLRVVEALIGYFNRDLSNSRNILEDGGGALLDIGCYPITLSRFLYGEEPLKVFGEIERDKETRTDILTSAILEFPSGRCTFTCSTQIAFVQTMQLLGTSGRMEIRMPLNPPADTPSEIITGDVKDPTPAGTQVESIPYIDQFMIQGDLFSRAIREGTDVAVPLEDSVKNMAVIDAVFRSAETGAWVTPAY
jgi:predicted dehydrogenase